MTTPQESRLELPELDTYGGWEKRGFQVRKGSKAVRYDAQRGACVFSNSQVDVPGDDDDADPNCAMEYWARGEW